MISKFKSFWGSVELMMATTIGAGMFSLPYVFKEAGWLLGIFYVAVLTAVIVFVHRLYWLSIEKCGEKRRLLGLVETYLGKTFFYLAVLAILAGLIFVLVAHLAIATQFLRLIFPETGNSATAVFWLVASMPLLFNLRRIIETEVPGTVFIIGIVLFIFLTGNGNGIQNVAPANFSNVFLPFGAVLFALSGWTAVEPMFEWQKKNGLPVHYTQTGGRKSISALAYGTVFSAFVYMLFVLAIFRSAGTMSPDTISGLSSWPFWKLQIIGWLGVLALWVSYTPTSLEIKNELDKDMRLPRWLSLAVPFLFPPLIFLSQHLSFLNTISLVGGVFLALQYVFIILVSKKVLKLSGLRNFFANLLIFVFMAAAAYEIYYFVVK